MELLVRTPLDVIVGEQRLQAVAVIARRLDVDEPGPREATGVEH